MSRAPSIRDHPASAASAQAIPAASLSPSAGGGVTSCPLPYRHQQLERQLAVALPDPQPDPAAVDAPDKDKLLPKQVASQVEAQVPFEFHIQPEHTEMWRRLGVRPATNAADPYVTEAKYCVYSEAFNAYMYTSAWILGV
ncbi:MULTISPECIES: hypothetical protein [Streptomyces]|uniref:hypothetical protein n=1 Tax=Streptomyces lycopersici TaxID=2974589 RepID=UPI0021CF9BF2|nr:hypothetical protein [Streptomyces sp. NEAU-383]